MAPRWSAGRRQLLANAVLLSGLAIAVLLWVDLGAVIGALANLPPAALVLAFLLASVDRFLMAWKWRQLIVAGGARVRLLQLVSVYYQSAFSGRLVPVAAGGDLLRMYLVRRMGIPSAVVVGSVAIEKVIALASHVLLALIGTAYLMDRLPSPARRAVLLGAALAASVVTVALVVSFYESAHRLVRRLLRDRLSSRWSAHLSRGSEVMLRYRARPGALALNFLLAAMEQIAQFAKLFVLGRALGIALPAASWLAIIAVVVFTRRAAAYFESWGLSEATTVLMFAALGIGTETAIALAVSNYAITTLALLPGAYLLWSGRHDYLGRSGGESPGETADLGRPPASRTAGSPS